MCSNAIRPTSSQPVTSALLDVTQYDARFTATIAALQLQLVQVKKKHRSAQQKIAEGTPTIPATSPSYNRQQPSNVAAAQV